MNIQKFYDVIVTLHNDNKQSNFHGLLNNMITQYTQSIQTPNRQS